jgi:hypothetical protein
LGGFSFEEEIMKELFTGLAVRHPTMKDAIIVHALITAGAGEAG